MYFLRAYQQVKDLDLEEAKADLEEEQRTSKVLEFTDRVYKPSKTIEFDRNGEVLLFSCNNIKHVSFASLRAPFTSNILMFSTTPLFLSCGISTGLILVRFS